MTKELIRKRVGLARAMRCTADLCLGISLAVLTETAVTILSVIEFIAITSEKVIYFRYSFFSLFVRLTALVFVLAGSFAISYIGGRFIYGNRGRIFGQKCSRELGEQLGCTSRPPSDAIKGSGTITKKIKHAVTVICIISYLVQIVVFRLRSETIAPTVEWLMWASLILLGVTVLVLIVLGAYLKFCKNQLELLLGQRQPRKRRTKNRRPRAVAQSKPRATLRWSRIRPRRWLDGRRSGRQCRARL